MALNTTSFGWMLGTKAGQRLAWCSGPGFGTATSHRAECWGKLSVARFLHHLPQFTTMAYPQNLNIVSIADNKGLVTTLAKRSEYSTPYPNSTLQPDWDLIEEIYSTYHNLTIANVRFMWVKGHQDTDTAYDELPVAAQYNVDADQLADAYLEAHPNERTVSPLVPAARCLLQLRNETMHGHYTTKIREAAALPDLFGYLRHKYKWSKQVSSNYKHEYLF
jgi:hypothetical protein